MPNVTEPATEPKDLGSGVHEKPTPTSTPPPKVDPLAGFKRGSDDRLYTIEHKGVANGVGYGSQRVYRAADGLRYTDGKNGERVPWTPPEAAPPAAPVAPPRPKPKPLADLPALPWSDNAARSAVYASALPFKLRATALCLVDHALRKQGGRCFYSADTLAGLLGVGRTAWFDYTRDLCAWLESNPDKAPIRLTRETNPHGIAEGGSRPDVWLVELLARPSDKANGRTASRPSGKANDGTHPTVRQRGSDRPTTRTVTLEDPVRGTLDPAPQRGSRRGGGGEITTLDAWRGPTDSDRERAAAAGVDTDATATRFRAHHKATAPSDFAWLWQGYLGKAIGWRNAPSAASSKRSTARKPATSHKAGGK